MSEKLTAVQAAIVKLGGVSYVARNLGHRNHTTVQAWFKNSRIPHWRKREVSELASRLAVSLPREMRP